MRDQFDDAAHDYDAVLIVSFGGPEGPDDVMPFLDNVLRGLPIKPESKKEIAQRYQDYGGVSPINSEVRKFINALNVELELKAERDNAEVRITDPEAYQRVVDAEWNVIYEKLAACEATGAKVIVSRLAIGDLADLALIGDV